MKTSTSLRIYKTSKQHHLERCPSMSHPPLNPAPPVLREEAQEGEAKAEAGRVRCRAGLRGDRRGCIFEGKAWLSALTFQSAACVQAASLCHMGRRIETINEIPSEDCKLNHGIDVKTSKPTYENHSIQLSSAKSNHLPRAPSPQPIKPPTPTKYQSIQQSCCPKRQCE
jgi:hypothetical protein